MQGLRQAQARVRARTASCAASAISTYIEACGIAPSQAVGSLGAGVGLWEFAEVRVNPTGSVEVLTGCHSTARATRRPSRRSSPSGSASRSTTSASCTATPTRCSSAWAPMARARARSASRRSSRRSTRSRPRRRRSPRIMLEAAEGDIEFKDGKFTVAGTDKSAAWGDVTLNAYIAHKFSGARARARAEGGRVLRSDQLHLPGRLPHLRGRDRSGDRR